MRVIISHMGCKNGGVGEQPQNHAAGLETEAADVDFAAQIAKAAESKLAFPVIVRIALQVYAPTLSAYFYAAIARVGRKDERRPFVDLLEHARKVDDITNVLTLQSIGRKIGKYLDFLEDGKCQAAAATLCISLDRAFRLFSRTLNLKARGFGPTHNGIPFSETIRASGNHARHVDEWRETSDGSNENVGILAAMGVEPFSDNAIVEVLMLLSDGRYSVFERLIEETMLEAIGTAFPTDGEPFGREDFERLLAEFNEKKRTAELKFTWDLSLAETTNREAPEATAEE